MQTAYRSELCQTHSPRSIPQITVKPGEEFIAQTELCTGDWLHSIGDIFKPSRRNANNPTVCIAVEGATPGSMLAITILDVVPDSLGYTGFTADSNPLACRIRNRDWGHNFKTVEIRDGFVIWNDALRLPISPMIGTLGTAPADEALLNTKGGPHGGNMDVQEVRPGSTVFLPVEVESALLHIGDVHAIQGDGEINCSGGIECRGTVRLKAHVKERPENFRCVRIEDENDIMTVACERSSEESFWLAANQLLLWMEQDFRFSAEEGYLLLGQVMEARITQFVNPTYSYICKMPKKYLYR